MQAFSNQQSQADSTKAFVPNKASDAAAVTSAIQRYGIQPKLTVNQPGDVYEQEADAVAEKVVKGADTIPWINTHTQAVVQRKCAACAKEEEGEKHIQRKCAECEKEEQGLQRKENGGVGQPSFSKVNQTLQSPGNSLDNRTLSFMESRFRQSFGHVRIHTDSVAAESAQSVNARAYTVGNNVVFGQGQFTPDTTAGKQLIAHELTHTIQQSSAGNTKLQNKLTVGEVNSPEEAEADLVAEQVTQGTSKPVIQTGAAPALRRQALPEPATDTSEPDFKSPQQRGAQPRATFIPIGKRGEDEVKIAVIRYMCTCRSRSVSKSSASVRYQPNPGFTIVYCRGRVVAKLEGDIKPSSFTTGEATLKGNINIAPNAPGGVGANIAVEGSAKNTGSEPEVGGKATVRVGNDKIQGGAGVDLTKGLDTGKLQVDPSVGLDINGYRGTIGVNDVTGTPTPTITFGGNLPGQDVSKETCRECKCPIVYECIEDVEPRDYEEEVTYNVDEYSPLRYYFSLDTANDTNEPTLKTQSAQMLGEVESRVKDGARISSIVGYASPEDNMDKPKPNMQLSFSRAKRLHGLLSSKVGSRTSLPEPEAGGELLGRTASPGIDSSLSDAIISSGFKGPEDVSLFLFGDDIPNAKLAEQFLALLRTEKLQSPAARLSLFGIAADSPAAPRLLAAIDAFIATEGKGQRPWRNLFGFLRFATVNLVETKQKSYKESKRTSGSLTKMGDTACKPYAKQAEDNGGFGPYQPEPASDSACDDRGGNTDKMGDKCDYN
ncbi:DUF4157 domain-containing protein [Mucilaginibacter sp. JRF]|uniref:eCIS core domain-containing protein n=1 Tax=Mucilaginibacter sp. JRF TaxID=2780088 RepID=UPI0018812620|nr:DUF4157 domain-containing protein [Mucilaginibacter sp. JRF]MBE9583491.1 DUF4157 domain-containing protein [Mucilaginibacter sp. JRF]